MCREPVEPERRDLEIANIVISQQFLLSVITSNFFGLSFFFPLVGYLLFTGLVLGGLICVLAISLFHCYI